MSTSIHRANYEASEALLRQAAERLAEWQRQRTEGSDSFVAGNIADFEQSFGEEARPMCELTGRLEELREFAPADLYEDIEADFARGAGLEQLSEGVERLEREAAGQQENRELRELAMADMARRSGGAIENLEWQPGGRLRAIFHFRDGGRMTAEMPERSGGGGIEIAWLGRTADTRDCVAQEEAVVQVVESVDNLTRDYEAPPEPSALPEREQAEREAAGGAG